MSGGRLGAECRGIVVVKVDDVQSGHILLSLVLLKVLELLQLVGKLGLRLRVMMRVGRRLLPRRLLLAHVGTATRHGRTS